MKSKKSNKPKKSESKYWVCRCVCGREETIHEDRLLSGESTMCRACSSQAFYKDRLIDESLLANAVLIDEPGWVEYAVPIGGQRKAGVMFSDSANSAKKIAAKLKANSYFEDARYVRRPDGVHEVKWGIDVEMPFDSDPPFDQAVRQIELGRLFGYKEEAIREFIFRVHPAVAESALAATVN